MSRHYCLTFFKKPVINSEDKVRYFIAGEEICPKSGKLHWQSYVEFYKPQRLKGTKTIFNDNTVHIEKRQGTRDEARDYCKKDNKFTEYGTWISGQGHRTDLETVTQELVDGKKKLSEIMLEQPKIYCQYRNGLKDIAANVTKKNTKSFRELEVVLLSGPTGCGKTRHAMEEATYKIQGGDLDWWQDYDGEETVCIDEYSNDVKITRMLALLDGYQVRLNQKGTHSYANWNKVFITTNLKPEELHSEAKPAHRDALFRRITRVINYWEGDTPVENVTKRCIGNTRAMHDNVEIDEEALMNWLME